MSTVARTDWMMAIIVSLVAVAGCATTPADRLRAIADPARPITNLTHLTVDPTRDYVVATTDGRRTRGRVSVSGGALILAETSRPPRVVPDEEIVFVGRVMGASRMRRGWVGAALGALVSLPFGISIKGDMVVPAAILGAQVARRTGDEFITVLLDRRGHDPGSRPRDGQRNPAARNGTALTGGRNVPVRSTTRTPVASGSRVEPERGPYASFTQVTSDHIDSRFTLSMETGRSSACSRKRGRSRSDLKPMCTQSGEMAVSIFDSTGFSLLK